MVDAENYPFLRGGGELGALTRAKDWSGTPIGTPDTWPLLLQQLTGTMLNTSSPMLICWGSSFTQLYNDAFRPILGVDKHPQALGIGVGDTYAEVWPTLKLRFDEIMQGQTITFHDLKLAVDRNSLGEDLYFHFSYSAITDETGHALGVLVICLETTKTIESLKAISLNKQIAEIESNLHDMVLNAPIGICLLDAPSLVSEIVNESFIEVAGKQYNEIVGHYYWDTFAEARPYYENALSRVVTEGVPFYANEVELMLIRHGKEEMIFVTFVYAPLKDETGNVKKVAVWVLENTTQVIARRKIEDIVTERTAELAHANNSLQKSNAELAQFAYIASHDLQEPLRKISTFSQLLENSLGPGIEEQSKNYLHKIMNESARMTKLIKDVLKYSQLVQEKEVLEPVDLNTILSAVLEDYDLLIAQKEAIVVHDQLPVIEAIPQQMTQLFGNLLGNALKFTRPEVKPQITIKVHLVMHQELPYIHIQFSDNGIGLLPKHAEQIFEIFKRLHRKSDYEGTGIGLAMCRKIVLNHHGTITAIGSSEAGAVFDITLPVSQPR